MRPCSRIRSGESTNFWCQHAINSPWAHLTSRQIGCKPVYYGRGSLLRESFSRLFPAVLKDKAPVGDIRLTTSIAEMTWSSVGLGNHWSRHCCAFQPHESIDGFPADKSDSVEYTMHDAVCVSASSKTSMNEVISDEYSKWLSFLVWNWAISIHWYFNWLFHPARHSPEVRIYQSFAIDSTARRLCLLWRIMPQTISFCCWPPKKLDFPMLIDDLWYICPWCR